jgi:pimeloyl-ACP methyl ester carboxylesterase
LKLIFAGLYSNNFLIENAPVDNLVKYALEYPHSISDEGYAGQLHALLNSNTSDWLDKINCPCLVIAADEDLFADIGQAKYLAEHLADAQYFCFNGVGHLPHVEQPESFSELVLNFMANKPQINTKNPYPIDFKRIFLNIKTVLVHRNFL